MTRGHLIFLVFVLVPSVIVFDFLLFLFFLSYSTMEIASLATVITGGLQFSIAGMFIETMDTEKNRIVS